MAADNWLIAGVLVIVALIGARVLPFIAKRLVSGNFYFIYVYTFVVFTVLH